jgi:hypothetical protein
MKDFEFSHLNHGIKWSEGSILDYTGQFKYSWLIIKSYVLPDLFPFKAGLLPCQVPWISHIFFWFIFYFESNRYRVFQKRNVHTKLDIHYYIILYMSGIFYSDVGLGIMVLNTTFNNISVMSRWYILLVEETGVTWDNHRPDVSHWQTFIT